MNVKILQLARKAHRSHWRATSDESTGDRQATAVTKAWQENASRLAPSSVHPEVPIGGDAKERIDLVDDRDLTAYELKNSGKNPHHEFFKDIFKVITYNHNHAVKLRTLVFITELAGIERLKKNGLAQAVIASAQDFGINIELETT